MDRRGSRSSRLGSRLLILVLSACGGAPEPLHVDAGLHRSEIEAFAAAREAELAAPDSWLSLIGLHWLDQGQATLGASVGNDIVVPKEGAPAVLGRLLVDGTGVDFVAAEGIRITEGIDSTLNLTAGSGAFPPDVRGDPVVVEADLTADVGPGRFVVLRHGALNWIVIRRGGRVAFRLRDNESAAYDKFHGIDRYPSSVDWRVTARWIPHEKAVAVPTVLGTVSQETSPAHLEFWIGGRRHTLDVTGDLDAEQYKLVFADETSGRETYGGGSVSLGERTRRGRKGRDRLQPCVQSPVRVDGIRHVPAAQSGQSPRLCGGSGREGLGALMARAARRRARDQRVATSGEGP